MSAVRVLVVDDSALVRQLLVKGLDIPGVIEVVGAARDPYEAREMIVDFQPQVVTLDLEMPRMNGLTFLKKLMAQYPLPVIMVSSLTGSGLKVTLDCLEAGAIDFVTKPAASDELGYQTMVLRLREKVLMAAKIRPDRILPQPVLASASQENNVVNPDKSIVALGASTGGTEALKQVLSTFPERFPAVLVVQHMPSGYTTQFAQRLNQVCRMTVKEGLDGEIIHSGTAYVAPGGSQMRVRGKGGLYYLEITDSDKVSGHKPSVDALFLSLAQQVRDRLVVAAILTGMGQDGAKGMKAMHDIIHAETLAQDEKSSVVFGMPRAAIELGGVKWVSSLDQMGSRILNLLSVGDR